jgi:hypothetical protein
MGFSGGGSNILSPHTHDGTVSQDGGPLDFNNVTQSQSSAGQVFYSDGVHLQQLAYPGVPAGETLTAAALSSAPSWAAGAAATQAVELLGSVEQTVAGTNLNLSFASTSFSDVAAIDVYYSGFGASNDWTITINGLTATNYVIQRNRQTNGSLSTDEVTRANINTPVAQYVGGHMRIICMDPSTIAGNYNYLFFTGEQSGYDDVSGNNTYLWYGGHYSANTVTAITEIDLSIAAGLGGNIEAGAVLSAYKLNRT